MRRRVFPEAMVLLAVLPWAVSTTAQPTDDFRWSGIIAAGRTIEIKGVNGGIRAELGTGNQVEVVAHKRARSSDPASVSVQVVQQDGNVTICAMYPTPPRADASGSDRPNECRPGSEGRMRTWENDVSVEFTVRIPAGVRLAVRTVNGSVEASSLQSDVEARSVNGRIALSTTGIASAQTVNGSIDASLGQRVWTEPLRFNTVNGSIDLNLPSGIDADLRAETLNGGVSSDFPITIRGWQRRRRIAGTIGNGGRELDLHTVNGSIRLRSTQ